METIVVNEKPVELLKITINNYRFSTSRGDVVLQIPSSIKPSELQDVQDMFELILNQVERWATE